MLFIRYLQVLIPAYLLGSIPVGYVMVWLIKRIDIRGVGSGHTGGTNVLRTAGPVPAVLTILGDFGKGCGAIAVAKLLAPDLPAIVALAGLSAVVGHNWSIFLSFEGGVGTMTTLGAAMGLVPYAMGLAMVIAVVALVVWRYSSLGSLAIALLLPLGSLIGALLNLWPMAYLLFAITTSVISAWALRANIKRLLRGTERRLGQMINPSDAGIPVQG